MRTFTTRQGLVDALAAERRSGRTVGFVPTMGALHGGHASLIARARAENDVVVVSVFVNPLQFGPGEDFARYPRTLDADTRIAAAEGAGYLFAPPAAEMYPSGALATRVEVGPIGETGEGQWRPGFFSGVATVCVKLFNIVAPDRAYFGQKDAQQLAVIRQVVTDLNLPVEVVGCPTVREPDGLAASSRNAYLDPEQRRVAPALAWALQAAREAVAAGEDESAALEALVADRLRDQPAIRLQYVKVFDPVTFAAKDRVGEAAVLAAAAHVGPTRLIDNVPLFGAPSGDPALPEGVLTAG